MDLVGHIEFDLNRVLTDIRAVNPNAKIFQVSATTGEGMQTWYDWLLERTK
jgi:hydrogenase nickel incorporation protein HypB